MKLYSAVVTILAFLLLVYVASQQSNIIYLQDSRDFYHKEVKKLKVERDSLFKSLQLTQDSLDNAFQMLKYANESRVRAEEESKRAIQKLNKIKKINTKTDAQRDSIVRALYPHLF